MKLFLDTSALVKLYHKEADSIIIEDLLDRYSIEAILLSDIAKVEFTSACWKKYRTKELSLLQVESLLEAFQKDSLKYEFIPVDSTIITEATRLLTKYGTQGLRTLDSIQCATALHLRNQAGLFKSTDSLLDLIFQIESLKTS